MDSQADKAALWAQLQQIHETEMKSLSSEREALDAKKKALEREKEQMSSVAVEASDIIEINAGGEIIHSHRSTLCQATGSMFSNLFTGRWDDSCARDSHGRVFLDHDPELVKLIVYHLRLKRIEDPSDPVSPSCAPPGKEEGFERLLRFFGLFEFFYPAGSVLLNDNLEVVQSGNSDLAITKTESGLQLEYTGIGNHFAALKPPLSRGVVGSFWKVTINALPDNCWIFLGVIGNLNPNICSYKDVTSFGWRGNNSSTAATATHRFSYRKFVTGECLHFYLYDGMLFMFSPAQNDLSIIERVWLAQPHVHFNFSMESTTVTVSSLSAEERINFMAKINEE